MSLQTPKNKRARMKRVSVLPCYNNYIDRPCFADISTSLAGPFLVGLADRLLHGKASIHM